MEDNQGYKHLNIDSTNLDPVHDAIDAVTVMVRQFVARNTFKVHMEALDNVTPAQWRAEVNRAAEELETKLAELMETAEHELHEGKFAGPGDR